jgi:hypothetical protein
MDTKDNLTDVVNIANGSQQQPASQPLPQGQVTTQTGEVVTLGNGQKK